MWLIVLAPFGAVGALFLIYVVYSVVRLGVGGSSRISGKYATFDPTSHPADVRKGMAIVLQRGTRVTMYVEREIARNGDPLPHRKKFSYRGIIQAEKIALTFTDLQLRHRIGAIVLCRNGTANEFHGSASFFDEVGPTSVPVVNEFKMRKEKDLVVHPGLWWRLRALTWLWLGISF